jgi:hypothetical protein
VDLFDTAEGIHMFPDNLFDRERLLRKGRGCDAENERLASENPK